MAVAAQSQTAEPANRRQRRLHSWPVRLTHALNAVAVIVMVMSGWQIYNEEPLLPWLLFPRAITLGGDPDITFRKWQDSGLANALMWHFAGMWLFVVNGLVYLLYAIPSGRWRRMLFPVSSRGALHDVREALQLRLSHRDITVYNQIQRLMYLGVMATLVVTAVAGLAIWKPAQFDELLVLFGGFQGARIVHFVCMLLIVAFILVHVLLALLVPRTIVAMVGGGPQVPADEIRSP